jgi:hypothetical protein
MAMMKCIRFLCLTCALVAFGCSSSGSLGDGGDPDDGQSGTDQSGDRWQPPDTDLGDDFGLIVPPGTQACAFVMLNPSDLMATREQMARVTFKSGVLRLSRSQDSFTLDLVEKIEWGAAQNEVSPSSPGNVSRTINGTEQNGIFNYQFTQGVTRGASSYTFSLKVGFQVQDGAPLVQAVTLDEGGLSNREIELLGMGEGGILSLGSCRNDLFQCWVNEYEFSSGDTLKIEPCAFCPPDWMCKSSMGTIKRAEFVSGQLKRELSDYFQSVLTWAHHDWGGSVLIVFDTPVGQTHGLHLSSGGTTARDLSFEEVQYLDSDMKTADTQTVVRYDKDIQW